MMDDQNPGYEIAKVFKWTGQGLMEQDRPIVREVPLTIYLNDHEIVTLLCLGDHLKSLAIGFLKSEGLISRVEDLKSVFVDEANRLVRVEVEEDTSLVEKLFLRRLREGNDLLQCPGYPDHGKNRFPFKNKG
jgi:FdhD protein